VVVYFGYLLILGVIVALIEGGGLPPPPEPEPIPVSTKFGSARFNDKWGWFHAEHEDKLCRAVFFGAADHPSAKTLGIPITSRPETHSLICGKTRSGKGVKVALPTLLRAHNTSVLCVDPKGENAIISARARALHSYVHIMNPWGELGGAYERMGFPAATFNPLDMLTKGDLNSVSIAKAMGRAMSPADPGDKQPFWADSAADLIAATLLWLVEQDSKDEPEKTLRRVAQILSRGRKDFVKNYVTQMAASEAFEGAITMLASPFLDMVDVTFGGIMSHVAQGVSFLADPMIARATMTSSFSMADLTGAGKDRPTTLYLVVPWDKIEAQRVWLRLMIAAGMAVFKRKPRGAKYRCLFLIDEFPALGKITGIEKEAAAMSGPGVDFAFIVQSLAQLRDVYGTAAEGIIGNCAYKWFCNVNDLQTADYLSKTLGKKTIRIENTGESEGTSTGGQQMTRSEGQSKSFSETGRDLLTPDEVLALGDHTAILLTPDTRPHYLRTVPYWHLQESFAEYPAAYPELYYDLNLCLAPASQYEPQAPPYHPGQPPTPYRSPDESAWERAKNSSGGADPVVRPPVDPTVNASNQPQPQLSSASSPARAPERKRPPIDYSLYAPKEMQQPRKPPKPAPAQEPAPEETRSGSPKYDAEYYSPWKIAEREAAAKKGETPADKDADDAADFVSRMFAELERRKKQQP
jgi:type IV secretion system protein VirD4